MKILDCETRGNAIRFYLGDDNLKKWYGDDWNDPGCNDKVYDEFIKKIVDVSIPYKHLVREMFDFSEYSDNITKNAIKGGGFPLLMIFKNVDNYNYPISYNFAAEFQDKITIKMGDKWEDYIEALKEFITDEFKVKKEKKKIQKQIKGKR